MKFGDIEKITLQDVAKDKNLQLEVLLATVALMTKHLEQLETRIEKLEESNERGQR